MDIRIPKSELIKLLSHTQRIVENKTTMPILVNFLLSAENNKLTITGSDLEITAIAWSEAEINEGGSITVNGRTFSEIIREMPDEVISIVTNEANRVQIKTDSSVMNMVGVSADEYPVVPCSDVHAINQFSAPQLLDMISKTIYAVSTDESRFNLNGVAFSPSKNENGENILTLVATDGHRLALVSRPIENELCDKCVLVPRKGLAELKHLLESVDSDMISLDLKDNFIVVDSEYVRLSIRLIDGEFPDYERAIPKEVGAIVTVNSGSLVQSLKRVALMVSEKGKGVKFEFTNNCLKISSSSPGLGDANEELAIQYDGDDCIVGYNARYVAEMAATLKSEQNLCMDIHGTFGAMRMFAEGDESYIGVVMPMRLLS